MDSETTKVSRWYLADLVLNCLTCLSAGGFGLFMLIKYGPTVDSDYDSPIEEIPDAPMTFCIALILGFPLLTYIAVSLVAHKSTGFGPKRSHFIIRRLCPKAITIALFVVVGLTLYDNQSSVNLTYVESWPAILFMGATTALLVMAIEIIRCGNYRKYLEKLCETSGITGTSEETTLINTAVSGGDETTIVAVNVVTLWRSVNCLVTVWLFSHFSLKYGLETTEVVELDDVIIWCVVQVITILWIAVIVKLSHYSELEPIHVGGKNWGRFWPEIIMMVAGLINGCLLIINSYNEHAFDYWPTVVSGILLLQVLIVSCFLP